MHLISSDRFHSTRAAFLNQYCRKCVNINGLTVINFSKMVVDAWNVDKSFEIESFLNFENPFNYFISARKVVWACSLRGRL